LVKNRLTSISDSAPIPAQLSASSRSSKVSLFTTSAMRVVRAASAMSILL